MKTRIVVEMETGTENEDQSRKLALMLSAKIPHWVAESEDFENEAIEVTGNDEMFEKDFSVVVTTQSASNDSDFRVTVPNDPEYEIFTCSDHLNGVLVDVFPDAALIQQYRKGESTPKCTMED